MARLGGSLLSRIAVGLVSASIVSTLVWYVGSGAFSNQIKGGVASVVDRGEARNLARQIAAQRSIPYQQALPLAQSQLEGEAQQSGAVSGQGSGSAATPSHAQGAPGTQATSPAPAVPQVPSAEQAGSTGKSLLSRVGDWLLIAFAVAWTAIEAPVLVALVIALCLLGTRTWHRLRRRSYSRYLLRPYRVEEASPARIQRLYEAWQQAVLARWWERLLFGQPSFAVELSAIPDGSGGVLIRFMVLVEERHAAAVLSRLSGTYQHITAETVGGKPRWTDCVVRLKKRYRFAPKRLQSREGWGEQRTTGPGGTMIDDLVIQLNELAAPATVQITLVPPPALFDVFTRHLIKESEADALGVGASEYGESVLDVREHRGAAESLAYRAPFFGDIRIAAKSHSIAHALAGTIRGGTRGENHLVERRMIVRRRLYAHRVEQGLANPVPSFWVGVYTAAELVSLWRMPNSHLVEAPVERHAVPRVSAPPQVPTVRPEVALGEDPGGRHIGLLQEDRYHNMAFVGAQGTGKTSGMLAWAREPLERDDYAVIVLDPKSDLALKALSVVPEWRKTHYVDFGRPEAGFDIFHCAEGTRPESVVDGLIAGFTETTRTDAGESQVLASSVRFYQAAFLASLLCYEEPSLWDAWVLLQTHDAGDSERTAVGRKLADSPAFAAVRHFFEEEWPEMMKQTKSAWVAKTDPPKNKIQAILNSPSLDRVLRHPYKVDIDQVIENRECLVVNGAVGEVGEDNCRTALLWLLTMIHRALQRQQAKPEGERSRVALVVDEARMVATTTLEHMLSMDRSAGIEVASAWQFSEQIKARDVRAGMLALHRNLAVFAVGQEDARELSDFFSIAYDDRLSGDPDERERHPYAPDALTNMPVHHAAAKLIVKGSKVAPFTCTTPRMRDNPERIEHHLEAQRARGGRYPVRWGAPARFAKYDKGASEEIIGSGVLPDDQADEDRAAGPSDTPASGNGHAQEPAGAKVKALIERSVPDGDREQDGSGLGQDEGAGTAKREEVVAAIAAPGGGSGAQATPAEPPRSELPPSAPAPPAPPGKPERRPQPPKVAQGREAEEVANVSELGSPTEHGVSALLVDLDKLETAKGIRVYEPNDPGAEVRLDKGSLELLQALFELRFLSRHQIETRYFRVGKRQVDRKLKALADAGYVRRIGIEVSSKGGGGHPKVYSLTRKGCRAGQEAPSPRGGTYISSGATFREPEAENARSIVHDLHVASWMFALEDLAPEVIEDWYGPARGRLESPRRRTDENTFENIGPGDIRGLGRGQSVIDLQLEQFENVVPDVTVSAALLSQDPTRGIVHVDYLVEMDRSGRSIGDHNRKKLLRYDALLSGWWRQVERYKSRGEPPVLIVVCGSEEQARGFMEVADGLMTGTVMLTGREPSEWRYPGRERTFFVVERDVHQRTTRGYKLPLLPPEVRRKSARNALERRSAMNIEATQLPFIPRRFLRNPAR